jgi:hypothetical protein
VPRGGYRGTVQVSLRGGEVRLYIAPAPGFRWVKPEGETVVDRTGAVRQVRRRTCTHPAAHRHPNADGGGCSAAVGRPMLVVDCRAG